MAIVGTMVLDHMYDAGMANIMRLRHRYEQIPGDTREEKHRDEDDADAQSGYEGRNGYLLSAIQNGHHCFLAHGQVAVDVLDFYCGVIYKDADRERQPSQRHDVDETPPARSDTGY